MSRTLIYVHDPMCSWCYGFENTRRHIVDALDGRMPVRRLLGGLAPEDVRVECVVHRELCSEESVPLQRFAGYSQVADGVRELSMTVNSLPRVKSRILSLDLQAATRRAAVIMDQFDSGRIAALLDDFNSLA